MTGGHWLDKQGIVMHEMLTGFSPFHDKNKYRYMDNIMKVS